MGIIPTFNRTYLPNTGMLPDGGQAIASGLAGVERTALEIRNRQQDADNATWFNEQDIALRKQASDLEDVFKKENAVTADPIKSRQAWEQSIQEKRNEIAANAPSERARRAFMESSNKFIFSSGESIKEWANGQQVNNFAVRTDQSAQDLYNLVNRNPTLENLQSLTPKIEQAVTAGSTFMAPDKLEDMRRTMKANSARSMIEGLMGSDRAAEAKNILKSGALDGWLEAADIQRLQSSAVNAERAEQARQRAEQTRALASASVTVDSVIDRMKQGYAVPRDELESAQADVAAAGNVKLARKFSAVQQTYTFQQQLRSESPARIQEIVGKLQNAAFGHATDISDDQVDYAVRTAIAEESDPKAREAVVNTILNRLSTGRWGDNIESVVTAEGQFEPWGTPQGRAKLSAIDPNSADYQNVKAMFVRAASDPTTDISAGATHFISETTQVALGREIPKWAKGEKLAAFGQTSFLAPDGGPVRGRRAYTVGGGITQEQALKLQVAQGVLAEMEKGLKTDPIATVAEMGALRVDPVTFEPSIDGDTSAITASLQQRAKLAVAAQAVYGPQVNKVFTEAESDQLTSALAAMPAKQKLAYGNMLYSSLGSMAPAAMAQIAPKEPIFAHAAGLSAYNPQAALWALEGQQIASKNPLYKMTDGGELEKTRTMFAEATGSAFAVMPEYAGSVKRAADAIYIRDLSQRGISLETGDTDAYTRAVNLALGANTNNVENTGLVTIGAGPMSQQIILPPTIDKPTFERYLINLDSDPIDFKAASLNGVMPMDSKGQKLTMREVLDKGQLIQVGNGAYTVRMPDGNFLRGGGPNGEYILKADPSTVTTILRQQKFRNVPTARGNPDTPTGAARGAR